jgi:drug/metabolite transporter (DMT)-like permease
LEEKLFAKVWAAASAWRDPGALISLVSFTGGLLFFGERSSREKWVAVLGVVVVGIALTVWK